MKPTTTQKTISHLKWFFAKIPVSIIALVTSPLIYPLAYLCDKYCRFNPFWFWMDDDIYNPYKNEDWILLSNGNVDSFWELYKWHAFRNTMWNLKELIKPRNAREHCVSNDERFVQVITDNLTRDKQKVDIYGNCIEMATFKWIDKNGNEGWQINSGVKISEKYTTYGCLSLWYIANNRLYFRYSLAKVFKVWRYNIYYEFAIGANEKRYLLVQKINIRRINKTA